MEKGQITDVKVYPIALPAGAIKALYDGKHVDIYADNSDPKPGEVYVCLNLLKCGRRQWKQKDTQQTR